MWYEFPMRLKMSSHIKGTGGGKIKRNGHLRESCKEIPSLFGMKRNKEDPLTGFGVLINLFWGGFCCLRGFFALRERKQYICGRENTFTNTINTSSDPKAKCDIEFSI